MPQWQGYIMINVRSIWPLMGKIVLGFFLGVIILLFFIAYEANAMVIESTKEVIRNSDILESTVRYDQAEIKYVGDWVDTFKFDEITETYTRTGNVYTLYSNHTYTKQGDLWFEVEYATTTLEEYQKATQEPEVIGLLKYIINPVVAQTLYTSAGDGHVRKADSGDWTTTREASAGSAMSYTDSAGNFVQVRDTGAVYVIARGFLPFSQFSIGANNEIASSGLMLTTTAKANPDDDGYDYVSVICDTTQPSINTLTTADYDLCGTLNSPNKCSADVQIEDLATAGNNHWYTITDTSYIGTTSNTMFGIREGHDIDDHVISGSLNNYYQIYFSEETGTDKDPRLFVEISSTTPEAGDEATSTSVSIPCDLVPNNELSMAVWCVEEWGTSTTSPEKTYYGYAHIPFFIWLIIAIPTLWLAGRLLLEFIIRLRRY